MIKNGPIYTVALQVRGASGGLTRKDVGVVGVGDIPAAIKMALGAFPGATVISAIQSIQDVMVME